EEESLLSLRRLAQAAAAAAALLAITLMLSHSMASKWGLIPGLRTAVWLPWQMLTHATWLVAVGAAFYVGHQIAMRAPDQRLARQIEWTGWAVLPALLLVYAHMASIPIIRTVFRSSGTLVDEQELPA